MNVDPEKSICRILMVAGNDGLQVRWQLVAKPASWHMCSTSE